MAALQKPSPSPCSPADARFNRARGVRLSEESRACARAGIQALSQPSCTGWVRAGLLEQLCCRRWGCSRRLVIVVTFSVCCAGSPGEAGARNLPALLAWMPRPGTNWVREEEQSRPPVPSRCPLGHGGPGTGAALPKVLLLPQGFCFPCMPVTLLGARVGAQLGAGPGHGSCSGRGCGVLGGCQGRSCCCSWSPGS